MLTNLSKEQQLIILGLVVVIVSGLGVMAYRRFIPSESGDMFVSEPQANLPIVKTPEIVVHVTGAVKKEGVYKLKPGDRIVDVLELAGGAEMRADFSSINLAEKVKDGQKIVIPVKQKVSERIAGNSVTRGSGVSSGKVNINSAGKKELCKVGGIGATTAERIIEYRSAKGPFSKVEDIMKVKSIGKSKFNKIKNQICL